ncbi:MAG: hypothetical protein NDI82_02315, partial [Anaeromyxobacteraceae bacterium]|nr:hypothetical protein [Anaeromyxobacteraceae bacterium]
MKTNDTYTAAILCTVAGINDIDVSRHSLQAWRTAGFLGPKNADQDGGWTRYSFDDLLGACALAEVSRFGVTFKTPLVANELAKQLRSIFKSDLSKKPIYLFADQQLSSGKDGMLGV